MLVKFSIRMVLFEFYSGVLDNMLQTCYSRMMNRHFLETRHLSHVLKRESRFTLGLNVVKNTDYMKKSCKQKSYRT